MKEVEWLEFELTIISQFPTLASTLRRFHINNSYEKVSLTAIDKLTVIWKSDLTDKMKRSFFQGIVVTAVWMHHLDAN